MNKNVVLFDLDGTLTPSRGHITSNNYNAIYKLLENNIRVGIVTGSSLEYVKQQIPVELFLDGLEVFSCNGTQHNVLVEGQWKTIGEGYDIKDVLGSVAYSQLVLTLLQAQRYVMMSFDLPYTGSFVSYRGSMVNWSPIGREATQKERQKFVDFDMKNKWRDTTIETIRNNIEGLPLKQNVKLLIKLAGETSFDIYPEGWDKTIVLKRFSEGEKLWFIGDRCSGNGNDKEIYEALVGQGTAFSVKHHTETPEIVKDIINRINNASL